MTLASRAAASFGETAEVETLSRSRAAAQRPPVIGAALREATTLSLEGISLSFGGVAALRDVDLAFADGAITAVIGPNGAGKTSLINVITGVYTPDCGRIVIKGHAYSRSPPTKLASLGVARTFQNLGLFSGLSTFDNIAAGLSFAVRSSIFEQIFGVGRARSEVAAVRRKTEQALDLLHLER